MKVAVSIPDPLFKSAERLAKKLKKPRSQLFAEALLAYVQAHEPKAITENLNEVYSKIPSKVDPAFSQAQYEVMPDDEW
jgi:metal-responsive CopG/Arc/MetJ family transcriptional regulator